MLNLTSITSEQALVEEEAKELEDWGCCSTYEEVEDFLAYSS